MSDRIDAAWRKAYERHLEAEKELTAATLRALTIGRQVRYFHGTHERMGEVIRHGYTADRVQLRTLGNKEMWIYSHRILDAL